MPNAKLPENQFPPLLRKSWYSLNQAFRRRIAHLDITPNQYTILRWLREVAPRGLSQKDIVKRMSSDPNTIAAIMTRLESKELITRSASPEDKRAYQVSITTNGKKAYKKALPIAESLQEEILSSITIPNQKQFLKQLADVANACQNALKDSK
jgi:DNA-binding MarR family transcriptional regulator